MSDLDNLVQDFITEPGVFFLGVKSLNYKSVAAPHQAELLAAPRQPDEGGDDGRRGARRRRRTRHQLGQAA
jgi:hypothetical protein